MVFHREHRSKKGRAKNFHKRKSLQHYIAERRDRIVERRWKKNISDFMKGVGRGRMTT